MKSNRLFAAGALFVAISFVMPLFVRADDNFINGSAKTIYEGSEAGITKDGILTSKIKTALAIDPITKTAKIHVDTANGIVNLTGDVPNMAVIEKAKEIAQNTAHVKAVLNNLKIENVSNAFFQM